MSIFSKRICAAALVCALATSAAHAESDPKPHAFCGWQMRQWLGVADRRFNKANQWVHFGTRADGPHVGTVAVWPHHVALVTGGGPGAWITKSGNVHGRIYEGPMSLRGVIAYRWP